jgi:hypothetical protein
MRFVKFGDENIKVFQAMATHCNRRNNIDELYSESGLCLVQDKAKADTLWESFRNRLGVSDFIQMHFDLQNLIQVVNLLNLDEHFSLDQIQAAMQTMPSDHALGPDDFNGMFIKKC